MKNLTIFLCFVCMLILETPVLSLAGRPQPADFEGLRRHPKIKRADTILDGFSGGKDTAFIIVNLSQPQIIKERGSLRDQQGRKQRRSDVASFQNHVIKGLDTEKISVGRRFSYITSFSAEVTPEGLEALAALDEVISVEPDAILHAHTAQGISLMNASIVRGVHDGSGLSIAICDTGIDYTHPNLGGGGFPNEKVIGGYDFGGRNARPQSQDDDPMDENGHGTNCAGIAAGDSVATGDYIGGVAPGAKLYALKISYGSGDSALESDMIAAWEWCITNQNLDPDHPIMIISTSFGGEGYGAVCDGAAPAMTQAAANAKAAGITLFVSSGNEGYCDKISWPACISDAVSVGAVYDDDIGGWGFCVDETSCAPNKETHASCSTGYIAWDYDTQADKVAPYSNIADFLDLFAPSHFASTTELGGGYVSDFGGTSAACPYAAGLAACMQSAAKLSLGVYLSPDDLKAKLVNSGDLITYASAGITKPRPNLGNTDIDDDGMPSAWEVEQFGSISSRDGNGDLDQDSLNDAVEYVAGTDPWNPDSDGDGLTDGQEDVNGNGVVDEGERDPGARDMAFDSDSDQITNLYLPLVPHDRMIFAGTGSFDTFERYTRTLGSEEVNGVVCRRVRIKGYGNAADPEEDPEWYDAWLAQDVDGVVWLFQLYDAQEAETATFGQADAVVWMPASPVPGQIFRTIGEDSWEVVETGVTVPELTTGLGPYENCLKIMETTGATGNDVLFHAPTIGCVKEEWNDGETNGWDLKEIFEEPASDFDFDADVDGVDLEVFVSDFLRNDCDQGEPCEGDFDGDNDVDEDDLAVFAPDMGWVGLP